MLRSAAHFLGEALVLALLVCLCWAVGGIVQLLAAAAALVWGIVWAVGAAAAFARGAWDRRCGAGSIYPRGALWWWHYVKYDLLSVWRSRRGR